MNLGPEAVTIVNFFYNKRFKYYYQVRLHSMMAMNLGPEAVTIVNFFYNKRFQYYFSGQVAIITLSSCIISILLKWKMISI